MNTRITELLGRGKQVLHEEGWLSFLKKVLLYLVYLVNKVLRKMNRVLAKIADEALLSGYISKGLKKIYRFYEDAISRRKGERRFIPVSSKNPLDISIILPSLREQAAISFIDWINRQSIPYSYEIILVAPFKVARPNVVWVEDIGPHNGSIRPINDGVVASRGQFISIASDDTPYDIGWYTIIDFIKRLDPHRRLRIAGYTKIYLALFRYVYEYPVLRKLPWLTRYHPQSQVHGIYFPGWFCLDRETVHLLGGSVFRKEFLACYADPDLGMRLHEAGEPVQFCPSARVICSGEILDQLHADNKGRYWLRDREIFNSFWKDKYGEL